MHKLKLSFLFVVLTVLLPACGGGGGGGTPPPTNNAPIANAGADIVTFSAQTVTLNGSGSSDSDGSISTYSWTQSNGGTVSLSTPNAATTGFTAPTVTVDTTLTFQLQVTDNDGATGTGTVSVLITPEEVTTITINGTATYDNVAHALSSSALDYSNITQDPIRGAVVELINGSTVVQSGITDNTGNYSFTVQPALDTVFVRVKAHALLAATASWDAKVVDNTNSQALYALDGSSFTVGATNIARPTMNAGSGWTGTSYGSPRAAAPFHILDRVMDGHLKLQDVDPNVVLPAVAINWSPNNSATSGSGSVLENFRNGDIGTSFYSTLPAGFGEFVGPQLFILGAEDSDTDEYDGHVIVHEWGHYFEANLSRSDSIGGSHGRRDRLDMRVAFGEGFGNAWSAIITDDPFYRDSFDSQQSQGFSIDMENNTITNPGWYSEGSVQSILYDIYDVTNDGSDNLSLGLASIYEVLTGPQITTEAFTSIFSFSDYFRQANSAEVGGYNSLLAAQSIEGIDIWGTNETNDAGAIPSTKVLPVYTELVLDGPAQEVCSTDDYDTEGTGNDFTFDSGNKLSVYRYVRFEILTTGDYRFTISAPTAIADPAMQVFLRADSPSFIDTGDYFLIDNFADGGAENSVINLTAGAYRGTVYEYDNTVMLGSLIETDSSDECFSVQLLTP